MEQRRRPDLRHVPDEEENVEIQLEVFGVERWDHVLERQEVQEDVSPAGGLEGDKHAEHDDLIFVRVESEQRQQIGEHVEQSQVDAQHNREVLVPTRIASPEQASVEDIRDRVRHVARVKIQDRSDDVETAQDEGHDLELDEVAGLVEKRTLPLSKPLSCFSVELRVDEIVVVKDQE